MKNRRIFVALSGLIAANLIAGCAIRNGAGRQKILDSSIWRGRLSLSVHADTLQGQTQDQSFSAAFELQGDPDHGELQFFTPLGSTVADIRWAPDSAVLISRGETRTFSHLAQLTQVVLGTDVPVTALFAWLAGQAQEINGWQVDLSLQSQGKIIAQRLSPLPQAVLRVILEN